MSIEKGELDALRTADEALFGPGGGAVTRLINEIERLEGIIEQYEETSPI